MFLYQEKLDQRANQLMDLFPPEISGQILGFADYLVKIAISYQNKKCGILHLYYSPRKNRFSISVHGIINKQIIPLLEQIWSDGLIEKKQAIASEIKPNSLYQAYVDGSCIKKRVSYGFVIIKEGKIYTEGKGELTDSDWIGSRQVGGELQAVVAVVEECLKKGIDKIELFYDYDGIEKWATGVWKANKALTKAYRDFIRSCQLQIKWHKVTAHSGDPWNEYVDGLAKKAIS